MKYVIANWKNHPQTLAEAQELFAVEIRAAQQYTTIATVVCPPAEFVMELAKIDKQHLGVQDLFAEPLILKSFNVRYVLVGHSDRRYPSVGGGENDETINKKIKAALGAGIVPVLLIGEKNRGDDRRTIIEEQLAADLKDLTADQIQNIMFAYEPVWAISTTPGAQPDTPESTLAAIKIINDFLSKTHNLKPITCLYGGSVNENNVADFLKYPEISGAVIGVASLCKEEFTKILKIVNDIK